MKKITYVLLCILLVAVMSIHVWAAGTVTMSLTPEKTSIGRGDSIVVTVAVSEMESCKSGSLRISYDTSVFERSDNTWLLTGTTLAVADGDAVFTFSSAQKISGNIYQFTLTAKSDAAFESSDVSVALTLKDGAGTSTSATEKVSITVSCSHSYDSGKITTEATCTTDGVKTYTCSTCGNTKTETVKATGHSYDGGKVTTEATCTKEGTKTYTCAACGGTKTETIAKKSHSYTSKVTTEATCAAKGETTYTCSACGDSYTESIDKLAHTYDNDCDADCNVCSAERTVKHSYKTKWSSDSQKHWHECSVCGNRKDEASHAPGPAATEWDDQTCTTCGYVIQSALGHTHDYEDSYSNDGYSHWYACVGCSEKKGEEDHSFDNACDTTCDTCGYTRETEHTYEERLQFDETGHWHACTFCGEVLELYPHNPGPEATEETDQICMDCGYVLQAAGNHVHEAAGDWLSDAQSHWHQCSCGEHFDSADHAWDEGTVDEVDKVITYRCTVCGYPKITTMPDDPTPGETTAPTTGPTQATEPQGSGDPQDPDNSGFPWWIVLVIVGVLLLGGIIFVIIGILVSRKQVGKYSG